MRLGWKIFLPFSLLWVFLVSGYLMLDRQSCFVPHNTAHRMHLCDGVNPQ
jgi:hypothetical protein